MNAPEQHPASNSESRKRGAVHDHAQPDAGDVALAEAMCRTDDTLHHEGATDDFPCWHCIHKAGRLSDWLANHDAEVARTAAKEAGGRIAVALEVEDGTFGVSDDPYGGEYDRGVHQGLADALRIAREEGTR